MLIFYVHAQSDNDAASGAKLRLTDDAANASEDDVGIYREIQHENMQSTTCSNRVNEQSTTSCMTVLVALYKRLLCVRRGSSRS